MHRRLVGAAGMTVEGWAILACVAAAAGAVIAKAVITRRRDFEPELRRELSTYGATLIAVRNPRLRERSPFPLLALDPGEFVINNRNQTTTTRIVTLRLPDGSQHEAWARIDLDPARPAVGLDYMQIDFSPKVSDLKRKR
jgi:hypothetical protein